MLMSKYCTAILFILITASAVQASTTKIYVWRNDDGGLVFSDSPKPGAEEVKLNPKQTIIPSISLETSLLTTKPQVIPDDYQVVITQPKNKATIRDNTGSLIIYGTVKPIFKLGFSVQLYLDGQPYQTPKKQSIFSLRNIDRGEHQIKIKLLNNEGKIIASSEPTTFYMHRTSIK